MRRAGGAAARARACAAQNSSHRHHARVSGTGASQGESTAATRPIAAIDCLNAPLHHSCGGSGRSLPQLQLLSLHVTLCWHTVTMSTHCGAGPGRRALGRAAR